MARGAPRPIDEHGARARLGAAVAGTALVVGSANALNMYIERVTDGLMARTRNRPLPTGRLPAGLALGFGLALGAVSVPLLAFAVNAITGLLAAFALLSYVLVYTPLKRRTTASLLIGAVPGAIPPLLGWTAVTGRVEWPGVLLFAIMFLWQVPHFLAIATFRRDDYARAGLKVLPVERGDRVTRVHVVAYLVALLAVTFALVATGIGGRFYLGSAIVLGAGFLGVRPLGPAAGVGGTVGARAVRDVDRLPRAALHRPDGEPLSRHDGAGAPKPLRSSLQAPPPSSALALDRIRGHRARGPAPRPAPGKATMTVADVGDTLARLNACLNMLSFVLLTTGFVFIKKKRIPAHRTCMQLAFLTSTVFLVSYVTRFALTGAHHLAAGGWVKVAYLCLLFGHMALAVATVPLALRTLFLARKARFADHRRIARVTFPIWAIVSITGVIVYALLYHVSGTVEQRGVATTEAAPPPGGAH